MSEIVEEVGVNSVYRPVFMHRTRNCQTGHTHSMVVGYCLEILWLKSFKNTILIIEIIVKAGANSCVLAALTYFQSKLRIKKTWPTSGYLTKINWHHSKCKF